MDKVYEWLRRFSPQLVIVLLWVLVVATNYKSGTWLTGWDNLHPEFDFGLNIRRSLSAVWQEYQGLGLTGGMGHAADLPRQVILWIASFILPLSILRYAWTFAMLLVGPLGVYFFVKNVLLAEKKGSALVRFSALVAAIFYLQNFVTVQTFFTPFEAFSSFYGFLPWLVFFALSYLRARSSKNLGKFFIISVLATPAFYIQTLFVVYLMVLGVFVLGFLISERKSAVVGVVKLLLILFMANAYWFLPVAYFTATNADVLANSKINSIATVETQLMNDANGGLSDVARLKGFWFDYTDFEEGEFGYLYDGWREHIDQVGVKAMSYLLFGLGVVGVVVAGFRKRGWLAYSSFGVLALAYFMFSGGGGVLGFVFEWMRENLPLFGEVFRNSFTKWSVALVFSLSLGLAYLLFAVGKVLKSRLRLGVYLVGILVIVSGAVVFWPAYEGRLVASTMKNEVPGEYFELFEYFGEQPKQARIAHFPVQSFWGWNHYDWGYRGSGFLWYGVEQPILDRAFDVWSRGNETFYNQISRALYDEDQEQFIDVLRKYGVSYALVDENIIAPGQEGHLLSISQIEGILEGMGAPLVWESGGLSVYDLEYGFGWNGQFVVNRGTYSLAGGVGDYTRDDVIFDVNGDYVSGSNLGGRVYPFSDISREQVLSAVGNYYFLDSTLNFRDNLVPGEYQLVVPEIEVGTEVIVPANVRVKGGDVIVGFEDFVRIEGSVGVGLLSELRFETKGVYGRMGLGVGDVFYEVENEASGMDVDIPIVIGEPLRFSLYDLDRFRELDLTSSFERADPVKCWERMEGEGEVDFERSGDSIQIDVQEASGCISIRLGEFENVALSTSLPYRSLDGLSRPNFCVVEQGSGDVCLNGEVYYQTTASDDWAYVDRSWVVDGEKVHWLDISARSSSEVGKKYSIEYGVPRLRVYEEVEEYTFGVDVLEEFNQERVYEFSLADGVLDVAINSSWNSIKMFEDTGRNCDLLERGQVLKGGEGVVEYRSEDFGSLCDYVVLSDFDTNDSGFLRLFGTNLEGRGLKFYLNNGVTGRNDLEVVVEDGGDFDDVFVLLPWDMEKGGLYTLNVENRSVGGEVSENALERVELMSFPVDWMSSWYIEEGGVAEISSVVLGSVVKYGTYGYKVEVRNLVSGGVVELDQGYEEGWIALSNFQFSIFNFQLPKVLEHVKVNGWANGFVVETGQSPLQSVETGESQTIIIFYWPQILEWIGLVLLLGSFGYLVVRWRRG